MSTDRSGLPTLETAEAADKIVVGGKAAALARARALGLPVLPGVVVPAEFAKQALAVGAGALAQGGSGAARLAVMRTAVEAELLERLAAAVHGFGAPLIVRSSSALEGGSTWAGAFSTFEDVGVDELSVAVRGVWASAFTVDAVQRFELAEIDPAEIPLAVLVQPQLRPEIGGTARVLPGGAVQINATRGPLADLVAGWEEGSTATVSDTGVVSGDEALTQASPDVLAEVAQLARRCRDLLGDDVVEWAYADEEVYLLQSTASGAADRAAASAPVPAGPADPRSLALALAAARFAGPLGEELVLPWAAALEKLPMLGPTAPSPQPLEDLQRAIELAAGMSRDAWQLRGSSVPAEIAKVLRDLLGSSPGVARDRLAGLRPVPAGRAREILELLDGVAAAATAAGLLRTPRELWRHTSASALRLLSGAPAPPLPASSGPWRWEPFMFGTVYAGGTRVEGGQAAVPGIAAGLVVVARDPHDPPRLSGREVVVIERPLPAFSPLLWSASGLVTATGNPGAHLLEVAHSLGVPSVVAAPLRAAGYSLDDLGSGPPRVMAVDGDHGTVAIASC